MASSLFGKLAGLAKSPQGQKMLSQATKKAQELANDPATRAKIDQGTARVRAEVDKRRGGTGRSANPTDPAEPSEIPGSGTTPPTVSPGTPPPADTTSATGPDLTPR